MALNIVVKAEPRNAAKGQFQCQISADAVTLTQRKKQIAIPVGVDARYAGKNQIDVTLPDCRLEMRVTKFGSYQNRLARDIAAFLSGGGDPPVVTSYSLPWYFYVVSALPMGIPILTLGGAIPAMIGFGLAGGCFWYCAKGRMVNADTPTCGRNIGCARVLGIVCFVGDCRRIQRVVTYSLDSKSNQGMHASGGNRLH